MKTVSVALVVCLNIGVDPPDVIKTTPCARLECWVDPHALPPPKAVDTIGKTLQMQYERWQPRVRPPIFTSPFTLCGEPRQSFSLPAIFAVPPLCMTSTYHIPSTSHLDQRTYKSALSIRSP